MPDWNTNATLSRLIARHQGILVWNEERHGESFVQRVLKEVHAGRSYLQCKCCDKRPKLYVAKHPSAYRLSRYPMTGDQHSVSCYFYDRPATTGNSSTAGIEDDVVRLSFGRRVLEPVEGEGRGPSKAPTGNTTSYTKQKMLGLFRSLWESAGLSIYDPGLRMNWSVVRNALEVRSQAMSWAGTPFSNSLVMPIPPSMTDKRTSEINADRTKLAVSARDNTRVVLIAPVHGWLRPKNAKGKDHAIIDLAINGPQRRTYGKNPYSIRVLMGSALFNRMAVSYGRGFASISVRMQEEGAKSDTHSADPKLKVVLVALCKVSMAGDGTFSLIAEDACLDVLTRDFIPCDSSYEVELARQLAIDGRRYRKPLISSEWEHMLPDFELLDVGDRPVPLEVFGFTTEAYLETKRRKIAAYEQSGRAFWYWDPVSNRGRALADVYHQVPARSV
ncbi:MAG: DUF1173 family protein [Porticoccaceae bacterium]